MKKFLLTALLISLAYVLFAAASLEYVNMENHGSAVTRVVVIWKGNSDAEVSQTSSGLEFLLKDFFPGNAAINYKSGGLVTGIEQRNNSVLIEVKSPFRFEQLNLGDRLAIDIFNAKPDKTQRLAIADFYASVGKLNSADRIYGALHTDFPQDSAILYQWANLLQKRGSARATEKLALIPSDSPWFAKAQKLMAALHGDEEPLPPPPAEVESPEAASQTIEQDSLANDTLFTARAVIEPAKPRFHKPKAIPFMPILIILGVVLLVFILFFSLLSKKKKPVSFVSSAELKVSETALDSKTMCRMVSKLIADGWTKREIARELRISQSEVEQYLQLCHQGGHEDD